MRAKKVKVELPNLTELFVPCQGSGTHRQRLVLGRESYGVSGVGVGFCRQVLAHCHVGDSPGPLCAGQDQSQHEIIPCMHEKVQLSRLDRLQLADERTGLLTSSQLEVLDACQDVVEVPVPYLRLAAQRDGSERLTPMCSPLDSGVDGDDVLLMEVEFCVVTAAQHVVKEQAIGGYYGIEGTRFSRLLEFLVSLEEGLPDLFHVFASPQTLHTGDLGVDLEQEACDPDGVVFGGSAGPCTAVDAHQA